MFRKKIAKQNEIALQQAQQELANLPTQTQVPLPSFSLSRPEPLTLASSENEQKRLSPPPSSSSSVQTVSTVSPPPSADAAGSSSDVGKVGKESSAQKRKASCNFENPYVSSSAVYDLGIVPASMTLDDLKQEHESFLALKNKNGTFVSGSLFSHYKHGWKNPAGRAEYERIYSVIKEITSRYLNDHDNHDSKGKYIDYMYSSLLVLVDLMRLNEDYFGVEYIQRPGVNDYPLYLKLLSYKDDFVKYKAQLELDKSMWTSDLKRSWPFLNNELKVAKKFIADNFHNKAKHKNNPRLGVISKFGERYLEESGADVVSSMAGSSSADQQAGVGSQPKKRK